MAAEQRKLLEQLMGGGIAARPSQLSLTDAKVCRSYVAGTCPHDLFTNTKQDLGPCLRVHAEALKVEYEGLPEKEKARLGFDYDYMRDLSKYIDECNRRIDQAQRRLERTPDEIRQHNELLRTISDLQASINCGITEVEILGEESLVIQALEEYVRVRQTEVSKAERERELKVLLDTSGPSGHQKLQVCDVCGAYLSRLDNDRRLADHFYGKMHLGYAQMRKAYEAFPKELRQRGGRGDRGERGGYGGRGGRDDYGGYGRGGRDRDGRDREDGGGYGGDRGSDRGGYGGRFRDEDGPAASGSRDDGGWRGGRGPRSGGGGGGGGRGGRSYRGRW
ncbi:hypothetical protein RB595_001872 [Gaeumannomyces hyphopodioides]